MQLATLPIAVAILLLVGQTTASSCTVGRRYCGKSLYNMGWYWGTVRNSVVGDWPAQKTESGIRNELFQCVDGGWINDDLKYITTCWNGCVDAGSGKSDYCK